MDFVTDIYKLTKTFPNDEVYGLNAQLRRAAVSIPSNISEGAARDSKKEFIHFLFIALGSIAECETQLEISKRLKYISEPDKYFTNLTEIRRLTQGLIRYLKDKK